MASPSMVQRSGDTLIVRSVVSGDRLFMDVNQMSDKVSPLKDESYLPTCLPQIPLGSYLPSGDISPPVESGDLPQCKIKRNYNCIHCNYFTQNPRHFLTHIRDVHDEKVKIYDCPNCLYASRHFQKLLRHMKMVHGSSQGVDIHSVSKRKSVEAPVEMEHTEDMDMDEGYEKLEIPEPKPARDTLKCSLCPFTTMNPGTLTKHERKEHIKTKFFPCTKCNYVTHIKARFTKHVKYHSMPMIKCEVCDFRTPYKWNLDRHMKNHGGTGAFCCSVCNFTADIKQSLTVHEMNHHVPPAGQSGGAAGTAGTAHGGSRRRNKVGGSDALAAQAAGLSRLHAISPPNPEQDTSTGDSMQSELTDAMLTDNSDDRNSFTNKIEMLDGSMNYVVDGSESQLNNEFINYDMCPRDLISPKPTQLDDRQNSNSQSKKLSRPIPNLIPLHLQTNQSAKSPPAVNGPLNLTKMHDIGMNQKSTDSANASNLIDIQNNSDNLYNDDSMDQTHCDNLSIRGSDESSQQSIQVSTQTIFKKKNASFFDKLKEKLLTTSAESGDLSCKDCGHLSKCLSEHSVHEKICNQSESKFNSNSFTPSGSGSTRCQHCRHRCKSSMDLIVHLQSCQLVEKERDSSFDFSQTDKIEIPIKPESEDEASVDDPQAPHPMENVVFVWNSMLNQSNPLTFYNCLNSQTGTMETNEEKLQNQRSPIPALKSHEPSTSGTGKKVFKCPHCAFWASTASRFHVHIVGHLNKKPFECSLCAYRSNWRWDITKHIRLKSVRDPDHSKARVLMTDETGRRNYSKYNKYLTLMQSTDPSADGPVGKKGFNDPNKNLFIEAPENQRITPNAAQSRFTDYTPIDVSASPRENSFNAEEENTDGKKIKRTMWKCKKCTYRNISKEALLIHVRKHSKFYNILHQEGQAEPNTDVSASLTYRCGHCYQVSNWKHVIQRHCRLKHNGDVKVIVGEQSPNDQVPIPRDNMCGDFDGKCVKCPFTSSDRVLYESHVKKHTISSDSIFKCFICSYYVTTEQELVQHLPIHGIGEPEQYISNILNCKANSEPGPLKRYKCSDCPYESNSKSQFMYHEQFHKSRDAPFKCDVCNYQVSKRHLLHQHMKVHKDSLELHKDTVVEQSNVHEEIFEIPLLWVAMGDEYLKVYKCRQCPFVHESKPNIVDHETMHHSNELSKDTNTRKCPYCTFHCSDTVFLLAHFSVHKEDYAQVLCEYNSAISDEDQISHFKGLNKSDIEQHNESIMLDIEQVSNDEKDDVRVEKKSSDKLLYFCPHCPARFVFEKEVLIHIKFHTTRLPYQCQICSYTARQQTHLMAHNSVHYEGYQAKTKMLQDMHNTHPDFLQPKVVNVISGINVSEPVWIAVAEQKKIDVEEFEDADSPTSKHSAKNFQCTQCPASFFKNAALHYHTSLHGGEGSFKCMECNYAVKTIGNLVKHKAVHASKERSDETIMSTNQNEYDSGEEVSVGYKNIPISGTDLFQHKTQAEKRALSEKLVTRPNDHFPPVLQADPQFGILIHGNPDFIYPTYLKNGRQKEKRYKCHKCPSAFEKREQYKVHLSLHGSKQRYKCELCDYSVKYYANYVQHMRKHQMNADAHAARQGSNFKSTEGFDENRTGHKGIKLAIKTLPRHASHKTKLSVSDQQTLNLMQRRRSSAASSKEFIPEEKKHFRCSFCPYISQRRDALDNHMRRHSSLTGSGRNFQCPHCDYAAPQSQFLRDHVKTHFNTQKYLNPEYFTNYDGLEVFITKIDETDDSFNKNCIFKENLNECIKMEKDNNSVMYVVPSTGERIEP